MVNPQIKDLNKLIEQYNAAKFKEDKIELLKEIHKKQKQINDQFPTGVMTSSKEYRDEFHLKLFNAIKVQFDLLGIKSVSQASLEQDPAKPSAPLNPASLPELISNMDPVIVSKMIGILSKGKDFNQDDLKKLYASGEKGYDEYVQFLKNHKITWLGGNKSLNFKITDTTTNKEMILKLVDHRNVSKDATNKLRDSSLKAVLTPIIAERQGTFFDVQRGLDSTRELLVTENFGVNLQQESQNHTNVKSKTGAALKLFREIGTTLQAIKNAHYCFIDMKNNNWLVDKDGHLKIADTQSFLLADSGNIKLTNTKNPFSELLSTPHMKPPEGTDGRLSTPFSVDKWHSFTFGKSLYQYLTNCTDEYLKKFNNGINLLFDNPIFLTDEGIKLRQLIVDMVTVNADQRLPMKDALIRLDKIHFSSLEKEANQILDKIRKIGVDISGIKDYVQAKTKEIDTARDVRTLLTLKSELKSKLKDVTEIIALKASAMKIIDEIKTSDRSDIIEIGTLPILEYVITKTKAIETASDVQTLSSMNKELVLKLKEVKALNAMKDQCSDLIDQIQALGRRPKDEQMMTYAAIMTAAFGLAKDLTSCKNVLTKLETTLKNLTTDPSIKEVNRIIEHLRQGTGRNMNVKADKIEKALREVPVDQRHNLDEATDGSRYEVLKALAYHRSWYKTKNIYLEKDGKTIDKKEAAQTFKDFKTKMEDLKKKSAPEASPENDSNTTLGTP
jgi:serine/threonine protein kinase